MDFFELLEVFLWFVIPVACLTVILTSIRLLTKIPDYIFRKILHLIAVSTAIPLVMVPKHFAVSITMIGFFGIGILIILIFFEHISFYKHLFVEKYKHEIMVSIFIYFTMLAILDVVFWLWMGIDNRYLVLVAMFSWALGDAAASIFGHLLGKHKLQSRFIDGVKSVEGSLFCFIFSFIISLVLILVFSSAPWWIVIIESLTLGLVVSFFELHTKFGLDNLTCPFFAGATLLVFLLII